MAIEIEESEYETLQKAYGLLSDLSTKPESKRHFERALKTVVPTVETDDDREALAQELAKPHLEKVEALTGRIEEMFKRDEERRAADAKRAEEADLTGKFSSLMARENLTEEGLERVKQLMLDRSIPDPEVAFTYLKAQEPPQTVRSWQSTRFDNDFGQKTTDLKKLFADEDRWLDEEIGNVMDEFAQARRAA